MFAKVVAQSYPEIMKYEVGSQKRSDVSENLAGLFANVCYSYGYEPDKIESKLMQTDDNQLRFSRVAGTGHHSIADHPSTSVYLGEIGKITAMVLNSLAYYCTSERSGRYTDMSKTASWLENKYYNKWIPILEDKISKQYPSIDDSRKLKLAQENARYFIDVTGPYTSMVYTTSYRQWSYIAQWLDQFMSITDRTASPFMRGLHRDFSYIRDFIIREGIGNVDKLENIKHRGLEFLSYQSGFCFPYKEQFGRVYTVLYDCSFSCLAQAQRHRTLKYLMHFDDTTPEKFKFYLPEILKDQREEWDEDMRSLVQAGFVPQGILVHVAEMGDVMDFYLKCTERFCGRAQREVAVLTANTFENLYLNTTGQTHEILGQLYNEEGRLKAKCELLGICNESCEFGPVEAVNRKI